MTLASIFSFSPSAKGRTAKLVRRLRAVQLSPLDAQQLPTPSSLGRVDAFLDQLVELSLANWLAIGEAVVSARELVPVRQRAWDDLEAKLVGGRFGLVVWSVRDAVDTAAYIASRESRRWSRHERETFAAAHGAAEVAALALLARDDLTAEIYRALTTPFATVIGLGESVQRG